MATNEQTNGEVREVQKSRWQPCFDSVSNTLHGKAADITLSSLAGEAHQSTLWQLHGVSYDPYDDALIVSCRDQEHVISAPKHIFVTEDGPSISLIEVQRSPEETERIRFIAPLLLDEHYRDT
jgi:hypothetical protein